MKQFFLAGRIQQRLALIVVAIALVTVVTVAVLALTANANTLRRETEVSLVNYNQTFANTLDTHLQAVAVQTRAFAAVMAGQPASPIQQVWDLASNTLLDEGNIIQRVNVFTRSGNQHQTVIFNDPIPPMRNALVKQFINNPLPEEAWIKQVMQRGKEQWYGPARAFDETSGRKVVSYAVPLRDPAGQYTGVVWSDISLSQLNKLIAAMVDDMGRGSYSLLVTQQHQLLATHELSPGVLDEAEAVVSAFLSQPEVAPLLQPDSLKDFYVGPDPFDATRMAVLLINRMPQTGWRLVSVLPASVLDNPFDRSVAVVAAITILGMLILGWSVYLLVGRLVSRPLEALGLAAQGIGAGDLRYQIEYQKRPDEIGRLATAMDDMKRNLDYSYQQLSMWSHTLERRVKQRTDELAEAQHIAQTSAAELQAVYDASLSVVTDYQLDGLLQKVTENLLTLLDTSYCAVWLLAENKTHLQLVVTTADESRLHNVISIDEGLVGAATREGQLLIVEDYPNWPDRLEELSDAGIYRAMAAPLMAFKQPIGAVVVGRTQAGPAFTEPDKRLLTLFANLASPVVRNAQLFIQREEARSEAERANSVKTRFLASVTHELRTPLNLIINNLDFMRIGTFGEINPEQSNRLDQAIRSAEHLLSLINDLLDISKIEAGEMEITSLPSDLRPVLEDALDSAQMLIERKKAPVRLQQLIPSKLPLVPMDARRVRQVLTNLLSNAVKFTPQGTVTLAVQVYDDYVELAITDTGMGIAAEEMDKLFQPFERTDRAKYMSIEGTGLGLSISRFLIEAHGGYLSVESQPGKGSIFTFTLPLNSDTRPIPRPVRVPMGVE